MYIIRKYNFLLVILILFISSPVYAVYISDDLGLEWDNKTEIRTRVYQDLVDNNEWEDDISTDLLVTLDNEIRMQEHDLRLKMDIEGRSETFQGYDSTSDLSLRFKEIFLEATVGKNVFTLGEKIVTWGKMDDFIILDRINPQDYTRFALFDKQERKRSSLMAKYDYRQDDWRIEAIVKPFFESSMLNFFGDDWAVFGNLRQAVNLSALPQAKKDIVNSISIEDQDSVTDKSLDNGEVAVRFASKVNDIDYSLYYMNVFNSVPVLREKTATGNLVKKYLYIPTLANLNALQAASPSGNDYVLERAHTRLNVVGADWETVMGEFGLRGEVGLIFGQPYLRDDFSYVEKNMLSIGLGADHITSNNTYFDVQFIVDHIFNYEGLFSQEETTKQFTGTISRVFKRGIVNLNLDWAYNVSLQDWMVNPELEYKFSNGVITSVGCFVFGGDSTTLFGRFDTKDLAYFQMKYSF